MHFKRLCCSGDQQLPSHAVAALMMHALFHLMLHREMTWSLWLKPSSGSFSTSQKPSKAQPNRPRVSLRILDPCAHLNIRPQARELKSDGCPPRYMHGYLCIWVGQHDHCMGPQSRHTGMQVETCQPNRRCQKVETFKQSVRSSGRNPDKAHTFLWLISLPAWLMLGLFLCQLSPRSSFELYSFS